MGRGGISEWATSSTSASPHVKSAEDANRPDDKGLTREGSGSSSSAPAPTPAARCQLLTRTKYFTHKMFYT